MNSAAPNSTATLLGGVDHEAKKLDGSVETVKVRQIPIRQFPAYLDSLDNEPAMVELLCGKEKGWSDTLTPESFEEIITIGEQVNSDFFTRWVRRRSARTEMLMPGLAEKIATKASSGSTITSQNSPSKPGFPSA